MEVLSIVPGTQQTPRKCLSHHVEKRKRMGLEVKRIGSNTSSASLLGKLLKLSESWLFSYE